MKVFTDDSTMFAIASLFVVCLMHSILTRGMSAAAGPDKFKETWLADKGVSQSSIFLNCHDDSHFTIQCSYRRVDSYLDRKLRTPQYFTQPCFGIVQERHGHDFLYVVKSGGL